MFNPLTYLDLVTPLMKNILSVYNIKPLETQGLVNKSCKCFYTEVNVTELTN